MVYLLIVIAKNLSILIEIFSSLCHSCSFYSNILQDAAFCLVHYDNIIYFLMSTYTNIIFLYKGF